MDRVGKYQIVEKIGAGGFSEVYKGFDPLIKRHVAIKTCTARDAELRSRFFQEAEIAGRAQHRNIVTVFDFGFEDEMPYLVQEYLTGEDLDRKVKRGDTIALATKLNLLHQIALGLAHAHEQGIIHRDIKPSNIRILEDGTAKIMDFGIAKFLQEDTNLTKTGMTVGTAAYLAPEQIRGHSADPRTDVFSFGVLAYELLTYNRPFAGEQISAVLYQILNEKPRKLAASVAHCPPNLTDLIMRCLRKEADDRPANGASLARAIESVQRTLGNTGAEASHLDEAGTVPFDLPSPATVAGSPVVEPGPAARSVAEVDLRAQRVSETIQAPVAAGSQARQAKRSRLPAGILIALVLAAVATFWLMRGGTSRPGEHIPAAQPVSPEPGDSTESDGDTGTATTARPPDAPPTEPPDAGPEGGTPKGNPKPAPTTAEQAPPPPQSAPPPPPPPPPATLMIPPAWDPTITVAIDQRPPATLDRSLRERLSPGRHRLRFRIDVDGYRQVREVEVTAEAGKPLRVDQPFQPPGSLTVQAKPGGLPANVLLDGEAIGDGRKVELGFVAPGSHQLSIRPLQSVATARNFEMAVDIVAGQATIVTYDLESTEPPAIRQRGGDSESDG